MALVPKEKLNPEFYKGWKEIYSVETKEGYRTDNNFLVSYGTNGLDALRSKLTSGQINIQQMDADNGVIVIQKISMVTEAGQRIILDQTRFKVGDKIKVKAMDGGVRIRR